MAGITKETQVVLDGTVFTKGAKVSFKGVHGMFTFLSFDRDESGREWVIVYGGRDGVGMFRAFRAEDMKEVVLDAA
jgi:hypothetical protein